VETRHGRLTLSFTALVLKNLFRQRIRTTLTVIGISVGIAAIVALGVVTSSLKTSQSEVIQVGGADFLVVQKGAADLSFSTVSGSDVNELARLPGIVLAQGALFDITRVAANPYFFLLGRNLRDVQMAPPVLLSGDLWSSDSADEILLGKDAASALNVKVGDTVTVDRRELRVVGIYSTGRTYEDRGGYAPLPVVQEMTFKPGVVTGIYVSVEEGTDPKAVANEVERAFPNLTTISDVSETSKVDQGVAVLDALNVAISVLAVGIGAIGVMNTMIMSVYERTREIGVLRAVGWSSSRIIRMIIGESLALCLIGSLAGIALGILATRALLQIEIVRSLLVPEYPSGIFLRAFGVAVVVALVGALYPAIRAVRLTPLEALRYE
jgi:putative ABC transport system permease protein